MLYTGLCKVAYLQDVLQGVLILAKEVELTLGVVGAHTQCVNVRACGQQRNVLSTCTCQTFCCLFTPLPGALTWAMDAQPEGAEGEDLCMALHSLPVIPEHCLLHFPVPVLDDHGQQAQHLLALLCLLCLLIQVLGLEVLQ
jgi:hypothetical protein